MWLQKFHSDANAANALDTRSVTANTNPGVSRVGLPSLRWMLYPAEQVQCCGKGENLTPNDRDCEIGSERGSFKAGVQA